jgi:MFS superfamily sulfate permease-like transporter
MASTVGRPDEQGLGATDSSARARAAVRERPQCVAYAQIAGLPPASGLAGAPVALFVYAVLGRAGHLIMEEIAGQGRVAH